jgi:phosphoglycolate phosphatase
MSTLIMDLDGTLIDSLPDVCVALNFALHSEGYAALAPGTVRRLVGGGARPLVAEALAEVGGDPAVTDLLTERFKSHYRANPVTHTVIYPGVIETLETLVATNAKLGICTNKPEATTHPVMQALDLNRFFPVLICGDSLPYKKPDRRHVLDVIHKLGGSVQSAIFVGDSETDILAARNAGIPVIAVSYGYTQTPVSELEADHVIDHFSNLTDAITLLQKSQKKEPGGFSGVR